MEKKRSCVSNCQIWFPELSHTDSPALFYNVWNSSAMVESRSVNCKTFCIMVTNTTSHLNLPFLIEVYQIRNEFMKGFLSTKHPNKYGKNRKRGKWRMRVREHNLERKVSKLYFELSWTRSKLLLFFLVVECRE